ncbi:MAG: RNA 2',3'-cyclic phosphodiesterase [Methanobacterium sp.]|nr:RNA 2',3'-cyclic phosphodiesterase [Methanobacterium sp.]
MRAFMAVEINTKLVDTIIEIQKVLAEANAQIKFVEPENLHFTFKFLGEITKQKTDTILNMVEYKAENYTPFNIKIKGVGAFPNPDYIKVLWLGIENPAIFSKIQEDFDQEFVKMGFKKERSYIPHLTIGRVKGVQNKELLTNIVKELEDIDIGSMKIDRIILKESELTPAGPTYTDIKEIYL